MQSGRKGLDRITRSLLGQLIMQDQAVPCKHDFILKTGLDMQMSCIFRLTDETASNMTSLAREMYVWNKEQIGHRLCVAIGVEFLRYWAEQSAQTEHSIA